MDDRQLHWIQKNRTRRRRPPLIGQVARKLLRSRKLAGPAWMSRVWAVLEQVGNTELTANCEPVSLRRGVLTLHVQAPAILYKLRLQWEQRLLQALQLSLPKAGITALRFTAATGMTGQPSGRDPQTKCFAFGDPRTTSPGTPVID